MFIVVFQQLCESWLAAAVLVKCHLKIHIHWQLQTCTAPTFIKGLLLSVNLSNCNCNLRLQECLYFLFKWHLQIAINW